MIVFHNEIYRQNWQSAIIIIIIIIIVVAVIIFINDYIIAMSMTNHNYFGLHTKISNTKYGIFENVMIYFLMTVFKVMARQNMNSTRPLRHAKQERLQEVCYIYNGDKSNVLLKYKRKEKSS